MKKIVLRSDTLSNIPVSERKHPEALLEALFLARGEPALNTHQYQLNKLQLPEKLKGLTEAVELLYAALKEQQRIVIVGDFDADGATSTALLLRCLAAFGHKHVSYLVPNRFEYGYGLTPEIVELVAKETPDLIVTVDNGISSVEGVELAKSLGINVLVTDHHLPGKTLPDADAIVNPNQPDCSFPSKNLAGVGVIFYVMLGLRKKLRESNWFERNTISEPNLAQYLDLVALGTVADLVPLDFNNRILVSQGIQRIRAGNCSPGILALLKIGNRNYQKTSANDFGFAVGPRLNAAGRLDDMSVGIQALLAGDEYQALEFAQELDSLNQERRAIEQSMQVEANRDLEELVQNLDGVSGVCVYRPDWHQGVVGILASRVKEKVHRPTIAFAHVGDGELKGSGRSISGVHLRDVLDEVATLNPGVLIKFGGHAMAAGLSLKEQNLDRFKKEFDRVVDLHLTQEAREPVVLSDGELDVVQLTLPHAHAIRDAGPWGQQFPEPVFSGTFRLVEQRIVGKNHLKMILCPDEFNTLLIDAIAFNVDVDNWPNEQAHKVNIAYKLDVNEFRGQSSLQLMVDYLEVS